VTLHPAEEVTCARRLTQLWLSRLRKLCTSRPMLKAEEVVLEPQCRASKLYSADLTAATDYIPHDLAQHVARLLCERLKRPCDLSICQKLFGPKTVISGGNGDQAESTRTSTRGIHMGLGPTWVILCLLNGFAAWNAGARSETYSLCGDDLIGYWSKSLSERYEAVLEGLGLVVNKSKSFFGKRGVFCERLVEQCSDGKARAREVGHLSAITAAKLDCGQSTSALSVADGLWSSDHQALADETRRRLVPRSAGPGRVRHGGNGFGSLTKGGKATLLLRGKPELVKAHPLPSGLVETIHEVEDRSGRGVPVSEFLIHFRTASRIASYLRGEQCVDTPISRKEFAKAARWNNPRRQPKTDPDLEKLVRGSQLTCKDKTTARYVLSKRCRMSAAKKSAYFDRVISRARAERWLDVPWCVSTIKENTGLDWWDRLSKFAPLSTGSKPSQTQTAAVLAVHNPAR